MLRGGGARGRLQPQPWAWRDRSLLGSGRAAEREEPGAAGPVRSHLTRPTPACQLPSPPGRSSCESRCCPPPPPLTRSARAHTHTHTRPGARRPSAFWLCPFLDSTGREQKSGGLGRPAGLVFQAAVLPGWDFPHNAEPGAARRPFRPSGPREGAGSIAWKAGSRSGRKGWGHWLVPGPQVLGPEVLAPSSATP